MKILLAGCGDLGVRTGQRLQALGHQVLALSRTPKAAPFDWFAADLTDLVSLQPLQPLQPDVVCHLATPGGRSLEQYQATYYQGLKHLLELWPSSRPVFISSTSVYGELTGEVDETTPLPELTSPAHWLQQTERLAWQHRGHVLRLAGLYGPGRYQLLEQIRRGAQYPAEPASYGNRIQIDDAAALTAALCLHPTPRPLYLGVDDCPAAMAQTAAELRQLLARAGIELLPLQPAARSRQNRRCRSRYRDELGVRLAFPDYLTGYRALVDDYQDWLKPA